MKLEGTTETIPLRELIEMISYSSVTGALNLSAGHEVSGHLYFRDGNLYHCDFAQCSGVEALAGLFELGQASFSFVSNITCAQESLWGDMDYHVRAAERLAYRWQSVRPYISSLDLVPLLLIPLETALHRAGPAHHQLLDRIDGQHTLRSIIDDLGWSAIDVAESVLQLSLDSLVDLHHAPRPQPTAVAGPGCAGLFDRILLRSGEAPQQTAEQRQTAEEMVLQALRG